MSFATVVELATAISFLVVMLGGKYKREEGWFVIAGLLIADAVIEFAGMGIVVSIRLNLGILARSSLFLRNVEMPAAAGLLGIAANRTLAGVFV